MAFFKDVLAKYGIIRRMSSKILIRDIKLDGKSEKNKKYRFFEKKGELSRWQLKRKVKTHLSLVRC